MSAYNEFLWQSEEAATKTLDMLDHQGGKILTPRRVEVASLVTGCLNLLRSCL